MASTIEERAKELITIRAHPLQIDEYRVNHVADLMTEFATQIEAEAEKRVRAEIADEIEDGHSCESNECWTCEYIDKLRGEL